jgi:hypothetical protein
MSLYKLFKSSSSSIDELAFDDLNSYYYYYHNNNNNNNQQHHSHYCSCSCCDNYCAAGHCRRYSHSHHHHHNHNSWSIINDSYRNNRTAKTNRNKVAADEKKFSSSCYSCRVCFCEIDRESI